MIDSEKVNKAVKSVYETVKDLKELNKEEIQIAMDRIMAIGIAEKYFTEQQFKQALQCMNMHQNE